MPALDRYLEERAGRDQPRSTTSVFCLVEAGESVVLGYYTLAPAALALADLPEGVAKRLPRYPQVPAYLLGRLAVARDLQGEGLGTLLLVDALRRCVRSEIRAWAVLVEASDDKAAGFYRAFGFSETPGVRGRMYLPTATVGEA